LRRYVPKSRPNAARWLGMKEAGHPRYLLVEDYAGMLRASSPAVPKWAVAIARPDDTMVFRLDLIDKTPANKLELVADHEIIHQLLNHLGGERLPKWFEEGLCTSYAGVPFLQMQATLELAAAAGALPRFEETRTLFYGNATEASKAYEIGHRSVRYLIEQHGEAAMRAILRRVSEGVAFEDAFRLSTGNSLEEFENRWREAITPPVPFLIYLLFENLGLTLLVAGGVLVFAGWVRWRLQREKAMSSLEPGGADLTRRALGAAVPPAPGSSPSDDR
jgi:hypothetical protein